ncbi:MAG: prepilin-type N-terminal cleavage/methylation domain-containing protein [Lachnospiraceae bacterium]|nr:prepilin-type N-terminal cleavage/methylation domain-containing protein [Lachnospiraceae bacterium]MEE3461866.1 prepilin-type N-terminal cleavage/methylation domain-containing protein [Lachnospiraceae bacterium]
MLKKLRTDESGFTLVELIITIAIMAILGGIIVANMALVPSARMKKGIIKIDNKLDVLQQNTMTNESDEGSSKAVPYLYLFKEGNYIKGAIVRDSGNFTGFASLNAVIKNVAFPIVSGDIDLCYDLDTNGDGVADSKGNVVPAGKFIKVGYLRNGLYKSANVEGGDNKNFVTAISLKRHDSSFKRTVSLLKNTGKHYVDEQ